MSDIDIILDVRGHEIVVNVEYTYSTGGGHWDEPPWAEVEFDRITRTDGRKVSKRLRDYITETHGDLIAERIIEQETWG